jgi:sugar phosphate permease
MTNLASVAIMRAVPASETGAANGLNTLMRGLGTSIAAALVAAVLAQSAAGTTMGLPDAECFRLALVYGLAAVICAVLAFLIPQPKRAVENHPALPDATSTD